VVAGVLVAGTLAVAGGIGAIISQPGVTVPRRTHDARVVETSIRGQTLAKHRPIVYIQTGHEAPGEPGYLAQTGASGGPFGSEVSFNERLAPALAARLQRAGVDARLTPAKVTPWGARGAAFISLHFDAAGGSAGLGYAVSSPGRGENYYHQQGSGTASPIPYPDSAPHRRATRVTGAVQQRSLQLARDIAVVFGRVHTPAHGAFGRFRGVEPGARGNVRMQYFYGYYRVNTAARVLIECGAPDSDRVFLGQVGLIAGAIGSGIVGYLRQTGQLH
jgi:hypothetical protein